MLKMVFAVASACLLAGCSSGPATSSTKVNIAKVTDLKSSFGSDFNVTSIGERAIDPKLLSARKLPDGLTFDPADCAKLAVGPAMPPDMQGNMAAVSAEGHGNRFIVIAVETSKPFPLNDPGQGCTKVSFSGAQVRGGIEVIDAPHIEEARTLAVRRVLQTVVAGTPRTGELYDYTAAFGDYQVIVIANPLVVPGQPVVPVDTQRARDLLVKAVSTIRT
ncbi:DUF5642 family protein [Mycobacterium haemophilum]|uniref:DUF5642 domain-containing protein n=1 Tax=Mycobacterium haemophilum TaxID=29311 RepID=A0A0I9VJ62_9MYCO|nr:DUF5642 family protein [Mycobacterium haemophilum]AKN16292.1 hypothetical protein B586_06530 [Mycobacterium haemophilum DSM 44634]KLO32408.1 hypothetical protein ABH39_06915 [Mycobacterium haemophilum]KLO38622.1 hypothetical protein ABH38_04490 [Mycobacterium haemophilum]KLO44956.1 hypothetical protein ABH37_03385 [Mycobacterium haemophilum]KLO56300.1 hypothetical protein ABH36_03365 [Mycobacterium haemophilum]